MSEVWEMAYQQEPEQYPAISRQLTLLAEARQAKLSTGTSKLYSASLAKYDLVDVTAAIGELCLQERRDGETAFPSLGTIDRFVKTAKDRRLGQKFQQQRDWEWEHRQRNPHLYCDLREIFRTVESIRARRAAGEEIPFLKKDASPEEMKEYLAIVDRRKNSMPEGDAA